MRASANLASTSVSVAPGGEVEVPVTVRNAGDTVEAYRFEILGVPGEWVTVQPPTLNLYPAGSDTVTVTFRPPRSARVDAGDRPFGVRVVPAEYPDSAVVEEGVLTVEPFSELAAQVQPPSHGGLRGARYRIDTDNLGNVTEQVGLAAAEGTDQVTFALPAEPVTVPNGTRAETPLRVRARRLLWWGAPKEYPFAVELRTSDGRARGLDAVFVQRPIISAGLLKLLAALLALLLALLALWFGLLRPQVETAAREAVEAEQARQVARGEPVPSAAPNPAPTTTPPGAAPGVHPPSVVAPVPTPPAGVAVPPAGGPGAFVALRGQLTDAAAAFAGSPGALAENLTGMIDDVDRALGERLEIFPVCHHSPASALAMARRLRAKRPKVIYLELCEDLQPLLGELRNCRLPVAVQAFASKLDGFPAEWAPLSVVAPITEASAEYQAIAYALETPGVELVLVDRSVDHVFQWAPRDPAEGPAGTP
ncbi:hypothetical protein QLR68_25920, partial [Micromonospora sp. DH15]|nr:hypothetical protein [Micromonospora sp. DH15]